MTGANRLLVGFAWPMIFLIFWLQTRKRTLAIDGTQNGLSIIFLGVATVYSFSIPIRGHLSLVDTAVMLGIFGTYLYLMSRMPAREVEEFVGPAAAIKSLPTLWRRTAIGIIFLFAAGVIFSAAEPFADGLVHMGKQLGIEQFVLVQWLAPLASESPEFLLAGLLAARGRPGAGMTILLSSKVSQWTLLIGSVPAAYSIAGTTLSAAALRCPPGGGGLPDGRTVPLRRGDLREPEHVCLGSGAPGGTLRFPALLLQYDRANRLRLCLSADSAVRPPARPADDARALARSQGVGPELPDRPSENREASPLTFSRLTGDRANTPAGEKRTRGAAPRAQAAALVSVEVLGVFSSSARRAASRSDSGVEPSSP